MKKLLLTLGVAVLTAAAANAQAVLGYTLSESAGTYTPLSDATTVFDGSTITELPQSNFSRNIITPAGLTGDEGDVAGFSLGFTLNLGGRTYTDFVISTAGYVMLGNGDITIDPWMGANFITYTALDCTAVGFSDNKGENYDADTKISYSTANSQLTVQFEKVRLQNTYFDDGTPVSIQVTIKADGTVNYVLDGFAALAEAESQNPLSLFFGMRTGNYSVCASGDLGSLGITRNNSSFANFGADTPDGTTITWNIPAPCVAPVEQPTDLKLVATSTQIEGLFEAAADADSYLVVYGPAGTTFAAPVDGTTYAVGEEIGDAKVAMFGASTDFSLRNVPSGIEYDFVVYAANSFGLDGPKYNTTAPLTASCATAPAAPASAEVTGYTLNSVTLTVEGNEANDEVVVLVNTYCDRDMYGDHGLFGAIPADAVAGTVIPVPEDYEPFYTYEGALTPENAGVVAYIGQPGDITIDGLDPSTPYYIGVYTRNAKGIATTDPIYTGASTELENPYSGDSFNFPRYELPYGWTGSENDATSYAFRDEDFWNRATNEPRQGTQPIQQRAAISRGDATNGKEAWMVSPKINVNDRHMLFTANYCITQMPSRFTTEAYAWGEEDLLQLLVSEDGENWTALTTYDYENHAVQEEALSYVDIAADLSDYRGKTVQVKLYFKTFATNAFGTNFYVDRMSLSQAEFPEVPAVTVGKVGYDTAVINWTSAQTDYEVAYVPVDATDAKPTVVTVEGASTYTITGLDVLTTYEVKVRGILPDKAYTEWSDPVEFTTTDWPAVDAPEVLAAEIDEETGVVTLSWAKVDEAESYEVAYRLGTSTEWTNLTVDTPEAVVADLDRGVEYVWKVRAYCTHNRVTDYSAQSRFTIPEVVGIATVNTSALRIEGVVGGIRVSGADKAVVSVYTTSGRLVARTVAPASIAVAPGMYIVKAGTTTAKVSVR